MDARAMLRLAADLNLFAGRAERLRNDAQNYRALGKGALADLLDLEADESEASAREALHSINAQT